jgi:hypothetical protein
VGQKISFVDTSILCNLLPVHGRDQDRQTAIAEMRTKQQLGETLILPVTSVVEAGNFIAQVPDGRIRRDNASKFEKMLKLVLKNEAPWRLHSFTWGEAFLSSLLTGGGTGINFVELAMRGIGGGDLCILTERKMYMDRTGLADVQVWTMDLKLRSYGT